MKKYLVIAFIIAAVFSTERVYSQEWAVKSNIAYDATASMNLGFEVGVADKWTLDFSGNYNPFQFKDNMKWKHWFAQPEARYWFCHRFGGHFLAAHLWGGQYNAGNIDFIPSHLGTNFDNLAKYRYEGYFVGAGIGYGYAVMLHKHWNLEFEIGVGGAYTWYDKYYCPKCGEKLGSEDLVYWGLTKLAVNLVYLF